MRMMDRRAFIAAMAAGPLALSRAAAADAQRIHRIGILIPGATTSELAGPETGNAAVKALLRGLREHKLVYGEHFVTAALGGRGREADYLGLATELVELRADVIVAAGPMLPAVRKATSAIPVVMAAAADPVAEGFAKSLASPGGNFTGLSSQIVETMGKRLELLKEIVPGKAPVAVMWEPFNILSWRAIDVAAKARGWNLLSLEIRDAAEIETGFKSANDARASAVMVLPSGLFDRHDARIAQLAIRYRLPSMFAFRRYVDAGGLLSYNADILAIWHRAADFVARILNGAKPGDLAIEQASTFDLVINIRTANALGITIPDSLLVRASDVIR